MIFLTNTKAIKATESGRESNKIPRILKTCGPLPDSRGDVWSTYMVQFVLAPNSEYCHQVIFYTKVATLILLASELFSIALIY